MTLLVDYSYAGGAPAADNWGGLVADVGRNHPAPLVNLLSGPPFHEVHALGISAAAFHWQSMNVGYGEAADYAIYWLVKGIPLGLHEIADLRRLTRSRAQMIHRAFLYDTTAGPPLVLRARSIYPLIETTEKTCISYLLGCAMAAICGPEAIVQRTAGAITGISYLFHVRLLSSTAKIAKTLTVVSANGKQVDFVGFDAKLDVHLFEAKGSASGFDYASLADGLDQCSAVVNVVFPAMPPVLPQSNNVTVAFTGKSTVPWQFGTVGEGIRCAIFEVVGPPAQAPLATPVPLQASDAAAVHLLIGTQLLGLYASLLSGIQLAPAGGWTPFRFEAEQGFGIDVELLAPTELLAWVEGVITDSLQHFNSAVVVEQLQRELQSPEEEISNPEIRRGLAERLARLGRHAALESGWTRMTVPQGYERQPGEVWLAFRNAEPLT